MPAPQGSMMAMLAKAKFAAAGIKLPIKWKDGNGASPSEQYGNAFKTGEANTAPDTMAPPLFMPQTMNKYHTDIQKKMDKVFSDYIDGITSAICGAWSTNQATAYLDGGQIAGPICMGGSVKWQKMESLIKAQGPNGTPQEQKYTKAIAKAVSDKWDAWVGGLAQLPLPWYPAFAAFPGPMAPPMPNLPTPFIATFAGSPSEMMASALKSAMVDALGDSDALHHAALFDAIGTAINACWVIWTASTVVTGVMGKGPIPTFAPPIVPVGPVLGGSTLPTPGHFV